MANEAASFGSNTSSIDPYSFGRKLTASEKAKNLANANYSDVRNTIKPIEKSSIANSTLKSEIDWYNSAVKDLNKRLGSPNEEANALRSDIAFLYDLQDALKKDDEGFRDRFMSSNIGVRGQTTATSALAGNREQSIFSALV